VRVAVDPLVGRLVDGRHLLLYRTVLAGDQMLRQGLALEVGALDAWLRERGLGALRLTGASLSFAPSPATSPSAETGGYLYRHRFAEPFDAVSAALALAPLAGGGEGSVYALSVLLLVAGGVGLLALYRMVAVRVAFAERRSNFVAAVTHELRTPLTAIRMSGEMLRDGLVRSEEKRREHYGTITAESERLGRLIENVLDLAQLERRTGRAPPAAESLGPLVEQAAAGLTARAEREGFALRVRVAPDLPRACVDRDALRQVLENLVENALKYARGAGRREIEVDARARGDRVLVTVRDFGPGVAPRHLKRIFEPFHRGEDERVRTAPGTGLGLALVRGWVERMGGAVAGRNAPGGGFEVGIELPAAPAGSPHAGRVTSL
jgi:signal transduction histidine kinase